MRDGNHRARIKEILAEEKITDQHMEEIAGILEKSGVIKKSFDVARTHIEKAQRYLELLPESPYVDLLNEMAEMLKSRAN
jgi:heptaprenyl diphosphate synthase